MKSLKAIGQIFRLSYLNLLVFVGVVLGGSLFGAVIETIINHFSGDPNILGMGILFSGMFFLILVFFGSVFGGYSDFVFAVYNSRARIPYLVSKYVFLVAEYTLAVLVAGGTYAIEASLVTADVDFIGMISHPVYIALAIIFIVPIFVMLFSALYAKFEKKFFWVMWAIWMIVMVGGPRIMTAMEHHPDSIPAKIGFTIKNAFSIGSTASIIAIIVLAVLGIVLDVVIYRNVDVRD